MKARAQVASVESAAARSARTVVRAGRLMAARQAAAPSSDIPRSSSVRSAGASIDTTIACACEFLNISLLYVMVG